MSKMTAKEMFKECGFVECRELEKEDIFHRIEYTNSADTSYGGWRVTFYIEKKCYRTQMDYEGGLDIDMKLHKAIQQQINELGWLNHE